jgi:hypothetical protein
MLFKKIQKIPVVPTGQFQPLIFASDGFDLLDQPDLLINLVHNEILRKIYTMILFSIPWSFLPKAGGGERNNAGKRISSIYAKNFPTFS